MAEREFGEISLYSLIDIKGYRIPCFYCPDYTTNDTMTSDTVYYSTEPNLLLFGGFYKTIYSLVLENFRNGLNTHGNTVWDVYVPNVGNGINVYLGQASNRTGQLQDCYIVTGPTLPSETATSTMFARYSSIIEGITNSNTKETYLTDGKGNYIRASVNILFKSNSASENNRVRSSTGTNGYYPEIYGPSSGWFKLSDIPGAKEIPPDSPDNPYEPGGDSGEGGGGGTFDNDSDLIIDSSLPTISSSDTGFTRIYNPTLSQVQDLARYLWTDDSVIQTIWNKIAQFFENPMDAIIGFNLVPVPVPNGGIEEFKLMFFPTGVNMIVAANQFVDVDCGTLDIKEYYGSALDYSPYTKISIFLPFIGMTNVDVDEVMGKTLQIKYRVDIVTGSCVAKIFIAGNCIYQFTGHCAINIPFSSADFTNYVSAVIGIAKLAVGAYTAGVGASLAAEAASAAQQTSQQVTTTEITNTARNPSTGRQITTGTSRVVETVEAPVKASSTKASYSGLTPGNVSNTVGQIMSSKPHIEHAGSFSGNSGYLGVRRPFALIKRPRMCMPANYQTLNGFPSMITMTLSECSGYTLINQVQLTGMTATNPEQAEILELLKSGVIF